MRKSRTLLWRTKTQSMRCEKQCDQNDLSTNFQYANIGNYWNIPLESVGTYLWKQGMPLSLLFCLIASANAYWPQLTGQMKGEWALMRHSVNGTGPTFHFEGSFAMVERAWRQQRSVLDVGLIRVSFSEMDGLTDLNKLYLPDLGSELFS
ncbi:hypothetical protein LOAG_05862 [Loa loa]|uniref:Uncharacterized protein n=2 Tax=Loa loa TaxID=7209 RepID=A0A1S0U0V9_LOALO|nr:hypothetical protein LOAG_05862 [Loa loa]EFO22625.1 hypothetical protein LOAG_05862 [Loa loa]